MTEFENLVVIDANFILTPIQFKVDFLDEIEFSLEGKTKFLIYKQVIDELQAKAERFERREKSAKFEAQLNAGKTYLEQNKPNYHLQWSEEVKNSEESTDDFLLRKVKELKKEYPHVYLATNDRHLRKRAKEYASLIFIRQNQMISIQ